MSIWQGILPLRPGVPKKSCLQTNEVQQFYWDLSATSLQQLSRYLSRTLLNDHCGEPDALIVTNDYLRLVDCSCLHAHSNDNNNKNNRHPCSAASFHKCSWVNPHLWTGRLRARRASPSQQQQQQQLRCSWVPGRWFISALGPEPRRRKKQCSS